MLFGRMMRHLALPDWWVLRAFPRQALASLEQAIAVSEHGHRGELRFVVEAGLPVQELLRGDSARARAIDLFSRLRVWDTDLNSGVLVYVQLVDRRVEIVADRGINARVGEGFWSDVCRRMESAFREGRYEFGAAQAVGEIARVLVEHFPTSGDNPDELPNKPVVL
jgi:uncharacterized membrane protein